MPKVDRDICIVIAVCVVAVAFLVAYRYLPLIIPPGEEIDDGVTHVEAVEMPEGELGAPRLPIPKIEHLTLLELAVDGDREAIQKADILGCCASGRAFEWVLKKCGEAGREWNEAETKSVMSIYDGTKWTRMRYCPFCGKEIEYADD